MHSDAAPEDRSASRLGAVQKASAAAALLVLIGFAGWLLAGARPQRLACFTTSVSDRSDEQMHNIRIAVNALDNSKIPPGETLSFNKIASPYTPARGYVRAPAIIKGALRPDFAGGVCQVSSTLYNAALLADLAIAERHQHDSPVSSVPPGRDATVAEGRADLAIRNAGRRYVSIRSRISGTRLIVCVMGYPEAEKRVAVHTSRRDLGPGFFEITTWRTVSTPGRAPREEQISVDRYEPLPPPDRGGAPPAFRSPRGPFKPPEGWAPRT